MKATARLSVLGALLLAVCSWAWAQTAEEVPIVQGATGDPDDIELAFPVPQPMDTKTPVAGFRTYARMIERLQDLAASLDAENVATSSSLGKSRKNRDIWKLVISDSDTTRDDGTPEPKVVLNGGLHAREWIGPEVVLRIAEDLVLNYASANDDRIEFLVNNSEIHVVVVSNPDGFVYSQSAFDKAADFTEADMAFSCIPSSAFVCRDGRLRRKSLRHHSDESFLPVNQRVMVTNPGGTDAFEGLLGVDLNRNHRKGYANPKPPATLGSSDDPREIDYRGTAGPNEAGYNLASAEPEVQRLASLISTVQPRAFIDYHSFGEFIVLALSGIAHRDDLSRALRQQIKDAIERVNGTAYDISEGNPSITQPAGGESGTFDEFTASGTGRPPAFTLELSGDTPAGFILRDSRVPTVAGEIIPSAKTLIDFAIGPAYLRKVIIWADDDGDGMINPTDEIRYEAEWTGDPRIFLLRTKEWVAAETARFLLVFSEPMKIPNGAGDPVEIDGTTAATDPMVIFRKAGGPDHTVAKAGGWLKDKQQVAGDGKITPGFDAYKFDTWEGSFTVPSGSATDFDSATVFLRVTVQDILENQLDGRPGTQLDFDEQWVKFEDGDTPANENDGGVDNNHVFRIDTEPPTTDIMKQP